MPRTLLVASALLACACTVAPDMREPSESARSTLAGVRGHQVGDLYVFTEAEARAEFADELWRPARDAGLVAFGMAPNGDVWALDPARGDQVVLLGHDLSWDEPTADIETAIIRFDLSLPQLLAAGRRAELPIDFWEARERIERGEELVQSRRSGPQD